MKQSIPTKPFLTFLTILTLFSSPILIACSNSIPHAIAEKKTETDIVNGLEKEILGLINQHRSSLGLASLQMVQVASQPAYNHSRDMALRKTGFGHEGFDTRISNIGKSEGWLTASAENVAYGKLSAEEVVNGWLNSKGHKKNIEGDYAFTGIGVFTDQKGVVFFTQIFYRKT